MEALGNHPQIPALLAFFTQDERLYIVQEFIQGVTLERELLEQGTFDETKIRQLLYDVLTILKFVHKEKVLHRDIKPPNIIIREKDKKPVLIDFGVAKILQDESFIEQATALGTFYYAAPEQFRGAVFPASDLYSLGVTCVYLMTGKSQIQEMYDAQNLSWIWHQFVPKNIVFSDGLKQILDKLLEFQPRQRYQSATEVLQALESLSSPVLETEIIDPLAIKANITNLTIPASVNPEINSLNNQINLNSVTNNNTSSTSRLGVYYIKLELLLEAQKCKEADLETWKILCMSLGKPTGAPIASGEVNLIPCEVLLKIDNIWTIASSNRFGFSIQSKIFESVAKDYVAFCDRVKWQSYNSASYHESLNFSKNAVMGHLPSRIWAEGDKFWRHLTVINSKFSQCNLQSKTISKI
ncbi:MAG: protein kinase [Calothrix sp. CSU_2_0]|nr:protein kinase [Calothrix sp. CSU_2_0]